MKCRNGSCIVDFEGIRIFLIIAVLNGSANIFPSNVECTLFPLGSYKSPISEKGALKPFSIIKAPSSRAFNIVALSIRLWTFFRFLKCGDVNVYLGKPVSGCSSPERIIMSAVPISFAICGIAVEFDFKSNSHTLGTCTIGLGIKSIGGPAGWRRGSCPSRH